MAQDDEEFEFEDVEFKRYYGSRADGTDLFFISLKDYGLDSYLLESSLPEKFFSGKQIERIIKVIVNKRTSIPVRDHYAKILIRKLREIPEISQHYFSNQFLDKYGKYCESAFKVWVDVISNMTLKVNEPYSNFHNQSIFLKVREAFRKSQGQEEQLEIAQEEFENKLQLDFGLQLAYVDVYSSGRMYFWIDETVENGERQFVYLMTITGELEFFFLFSL